MTEQYINSRGKGTECGWILKALRVSSFIHNSGGGIKNWAVGGITVVPQRALKATRRGTLNPTAESNWGQERQTRMEVREPLMNCSPKSTPASAGLGSASLTLIPGTP